MSETRGIFPDENSSRFLQHCLRCILFSVFDKNVPQGTIGRSDGRVWARARVLGDFWASRQAQPVQDPVGRRPCQGRRLTGQCRVDDWGTLVDKRSRLQYRNNPYPPRTGSSRYVYSFDINTEITRTHPGPDPLRLQYRLQYREHSHPARAGSSRYVVSISIQKAPVPTPGRILYVYNIDLKTESTRTHPGPDPLRLQY